MEFSFSLKIKATKEDAWEYYANIEKWYNWEEDLKNITLKGKFETGWSLKECLLWNISLLL